MLEVALAMLLRSLRVSLALLCLAGCGRLHGDSTRIRIEKANEFLEKEGLERTREILATLIAFPTVSEKTRAQSRPAFRDMAAYLKRWSTGLGFEFRNVGPNEIWEIDTTGRGNTRVAWIAHADVVPPEGSTEAFNGHSVPKEWATPPFVLTSKNGRLYGRGAEDDKGPLAAIMVTLETLARFDLLPRQNIRVIIGTGEESDWTAIEELAAKGKLADHVVSVDGAFPLVMGESGFVSWYIRIPPQRLKATGPCWEAEDVSAGHFLTQIPARATMRVKVPATSTKNEHSKQLANLERLKSKFQMEFASTDDDTMTLTFKGRSIHASHAPDGDNAIWQLARFAAEVPLCRGDVSTALSLLREFFVGDHHGKKLGIFYTHPFMGPLIVAPTLLEATADGVEIGVNMRRPEGLSHAAFDERLTAALELLKHYDGMVIEEVERFIGEPVLVDPKSFTASELLSTYRDLARDPSAKPLSEPWTTYAGLFPGAVSFGPVMPRKASNAHVANEYIESAVLDFVTRAYLRSSLRLAPPR